MTDKQVIVKSLIVKPGMEQAARAILNAEIEVVVDPLMIDDWQLVTNKPHYSSAPSIPDLIHFH